MSHGKQLIKLEQIGAYEPVLFIEMSDLRFEFPEIKARKINLPSVETDLVRLKIGSTCSFLGC